MTIRLILLATVLAIPVSAASAQSAAQYGTYGVYGIAPGEKVTVPASKDEVWRLQVLDLRREALEMQERDGGTLTPEHRAMLQAKLDRINAQAQRD